MIYFPKFYENDKDKEIEYLREQLTHARRSVIHLSRTDIHGFYGFMDCNSRDETYKWGRDIRQEIIDQAEEVTGENYWGQKMYYGRAVCPLCGDWPGNEHGYTIPEGLSRHLEGFGRMHQCIVAKNLYRLAVDYWDKKFSQKEKEDALKEIEIKKQRLKSETLIQIAPGYPPELFDDPWERGSTKNQKQHLDRLVWAENRLEDLGFSIQVSNNVKSYTKEYDEFVIFADPRHKGSIQFEAYKKPLPKKISGGRRASTKHIGYFAILDGWKHDLNNKFEQRVKALQI